MCHVFVSTVFRYVKPYMRLHNVEVWYFLNQTGFLGKDLVKLHELKMLYLPVLFDFGEIGAVVVTMSHSGQ